MNKYSLTPLKRFFRLLQVDKKEITSIYVFALFNGVIALSLPLGIQAIINLISMGQVSTSWILLVVFVIAGIAFTGITQIMQLSIAENIQQKIFTRSAFEFAYRIPKMKIEATEKFHLPELVNRFFDTLAIQKGLSKILLDFSSASLQVFFGLILLCLYHPFFILFSFSLVIILFLIFKFTAPLGLKTSLKESTHKYKVAHWLEEIAKNIETFKLAGKTQLPIEKTDEEVHRYIVSRKTHFKTLIVQYANLVAFKVLIATGLLVIGGLLVINQQMNIGQFVASEIIIILVLNSIEKLILSMETIYDVITSVEKIGAVADLPIESYETEDLENSNPNMPMSIQIKNLSYKFQNSNDYILKNINATISPGQKICITGSQGSGKTLFLKILAGFYYRFSGTLSYNNLPFGNWDKSALRNQIGSCFINESIFEGTFKDNITLGKPEINDQQIEKALQITGLNEFSFSLYKGYNSKLMSNGKTLPGSIKSKLIMTRAIVKNQPLYLIEDCFTNVSEEDRSRFFSYLLSTKATVIIVSKDKQIAQKADSLYVFQSGEIIANDTYENLKHQAWFNSLFKKD